MSSPISIIQYFQEHDGNNVNDDDYNNNIVIDNIYLLENSINDDYYEEDKIDKQYFLGSCCYFQGSGLLLSSCIKSTTFYKYTLDIILLYLKISSVYYVENPKIDIIQLRIIGESYTAIKKTYWLRIIQKHWKKTFKERTRIIHKRGSPQNQNYRSINGFYPENIKRIPTIKGLLHMYNKYNKKE